MATLCITPVCKTSLEFFPVIIDFQHVLHFDVGRNQIRSILKVKFEPYSLIESTAILSDILLCTVHAGHAYVVLIL